MDPVITHQSSSPDPQSNRPTGALTIDSCSNESSNPGLHLLNLPQEIQDTIFEYVYPSRGEFKTISRSSWEIRERSIRRDHGKSYQLRPFQDPLVSELLISKRFFLGAVKAFIGNRVVLSPYRYYDSRSTSLHLNIVHRFVKVAEVSFIDVEWFLGDGPLVQQQKRLTITGGRYDLELSGTLWPCEDKLTEDDFQNIANHYHLEHLVHVQEYSFRFDGCDLSRLSRGNYAIWKSNVQRFGEFMERYVTGLKISEETKRNETKSSVSSKSRISQNDDTNQQIVKGRGNHAIWRSNVKRFGELVGRYVTGSKLSGETKRNETKSSVSSESSISQNDDTNRQTLKGKHMVSKVQSAVDSKARQAPKRKRLESSISSQDEEIQQETEGGGMSLEADSTAEMTIEQLPDTEEEMIKLLKTDGKRVMAVIAAMKNSVKKVEHQE